MDITSLLIRLVSDAVLLAIVGVIRGAMAKETRELYKPAAGQWIKAPRR